MPCPIPLVRQDPIARRCKTDQDPLSDNQIIILSSCPVDLLLLQTTREGIFRNPSNARKARSHQWYSTSPIRELDLLGAFFLIFLGFKKILKYIHVLPLMIFKQQIHCVIHTKYELNHEIEIELDPNRIDKEQHQLCRKLKNWGPTFSECTQSGTAAFGSVRIQTVLIILILHDCLSLVVSSSGHDNADFGETAWQSSSSSITAYWTSTLPFQLDYWISTLYRYPLFNMSYFIFILDFVLVKEKHLLQESRIDHKPTVVRFL